VFCAQESRQLSLFCDNSGGDDCTKLSKPKSNSVVVKPSKVKAKKQNTKLAVNDKKVSAEALPPARSFSEFDEYALHISTECVTTINHKTIDQAHSVTDESIKNLEKKVVKGIKLKKPKRGQKKKVQTLSIAPDFDNSEKLVEIGETVADPEICRSAELNFESTVEWYAAPVTHIREASCFEVEPSECSSGHHQSHEISLCPTEGERQEKLSPLLESCFLPVDDISAAMARQQYNSRGLALTSTPHHLAVFRRIAHSRSKLMCSGIQFSDIESPSGMEDAGMLKGQLRLSHDFSVCGQDYEFDVCIFFNLRLHCVHIICIY